MTPTVSKLAVFALLLGACGCGGSDVQGPDTSSDLRIESSPLFIAFGQIQQLTATRLNSSGDRIAVTDGSWSSSSSVITLTGSGLATAAANGLTTVTVRSGNATATARLSVLQRVDDLVLETSDTTLSTLGVRTQVDAIGFDSLQNRVTRSVVLSWASSDVSVLTISSDGAARGVSNGMATVTAAVGAVQGNLELTVDGPPREDIEGVIAIQNVTLVPMTFEGSVPNQTVVTSNGAITAVGPSTTTPIPEGAFIIDGTGQFLIPGLADMHVHAISQGDFLAAVGAGVTTVMSMGEFDFNIEPVLTWRDQVRNGIIVGPTSYIGAWVKSPLDPAPPNLTRISTPDEARAWVRESASRGYDFMKVFNNNSPEVLAAVIDEGKMFGMAAMGHASRFVGANAGLDMGVVMLAHSQEHFFSDFNADLAQVSLPHALDGFLRNGAYMTSSLVPQEMIVTLWGGNPAGRAELLSRPGNDYVLQWWKDSASGGWAGQEAFYAGRGSGRFQEYQPIYDDQKAFVKGLYDAGVPILLGTDAPFAVGSAPGFAVHEEARLLSEAGLSNFEVMRTATVVPNEFVQSFMVDAPPFGTIEVGNEADLVLLHANPLLDIAALRTRSGVMTRGRWLSETELKARLDALAESLGR